MLHDAISLGEFVGYNMSFKRFNTIKSICTFWTSCL